MKDGTRTRDRLDHNQELYRLSYLHHRAGPRARAGGTIAQAAPRERDVRRPATLPSSAAAVAGFMHARPARRAPRARAGERAAWHDQPDPSGSAPHTTNEHASPRTGSTTHLGTLGLDGRPARRPRRVDASRNRERILAAAGRVLAERPAEATMEEIAAAAGVGKGTLYRNFSGRAELARALLDERARRTQSTVLGEAAPAAGGDADVRLARVLTSLLDFTLDNLDLLCIAEEAPAPERRASGAYLWQRQVVSALLREAAEGGAQVDVDHLADGLLALVQPDLVRHQMRAVGLAPARIRSGIERLARAAVPPQGGAVDTSRPAVTTPRARPRRSQAQ